MDLIADLIKERFRENSLRAALEFKVRLSFEEKILFRIVKRQTEP